MHGNCLNDRSLKVSLPEEGGKDGMDRRDRGPGYMGDDDRTMGDWRKAPRSEQPMPSSHSQQYSSAARPDMSEEMAGPWRSAARPADSAPRNGYDRPPNRAYEPAGGAFRDSRSGYDSPYGDDRRPAGGAFSDRRPGAGFENFSRGPPRDDTRRADGYDNSGRDSYRDAPRQSSRYDDYSRRPAYSDRHDDRFDRTSDYDRPARTAAYDRPIHDPPARSDDYGRENLAPQQEEALKTRPKLQLKPRSKPLDEIAAPAPVASKSIFGDAKPVDTTRKELEVEQKLKSLELKEPPVESVGRARTTSSGSGSGSTSNRSRKESESDRRDDDRPRRTENFAPREADYGRRADRPAPDRGYDNRDRRPAYGSDQRRPMNDDRRRNDRPIQERPALNLTRRDDRRDDRGPVRPRAEEDRRPERRPQSNSERDNNNGVKYDAAKREAVSILPSLVTQSVSALIDVKLFCRSIR